MKNTLKPTLWRTCRALMNPTRLRLFRIALEHDGELCVRDCARHLGLTDSVAGIYLPQPRKGRLRESELKPCFEIRGKKFFAKQTLKTHRRDKER